MNVLILVPNLSLGGQQKVAINTADILSNFHQVKIAIFDNSNVRFFPNCEVINLDVPSNKDVLKKIVNTFKRANRLKKLKKSFKSDVVYSFGPSANIVNCLSRGNGKKIISIRGFKSSKLRFFEKIIYRKAKSILCVSKSIKAEIDQKNYYLREKTCVIYNPYSIEKMDILAKEQVDDFIFNKPTIISHGRLNSIKNFSRLIKAFSIVSNDYDYNLLIIGEGEEEQYLKKIIEKYNLNEKVFLIGYRENPFKYIAKSSLFVLSSINEGFPNALIEGMCYLPVVSVDCESGPREILSLNDIVEVSDYKICDYGILVHNAQCDQNDIEINQDDYILADAIKLYCSDIDLMNEMKKKARMRVFDFGYDNYYKELIKYFEGS